MTTATTNPIVTGHRTSILARLGAFFIAYSEKSARTEEIAQLRALSDADLAERGLTRDSIVHHVFSDKLYL